MRGSFAPVALVAEVANIMAVHPSFPAKTLKEFVEYCKEQGPNNVTYSSPGVGSAGHLSMEYLQIVAGIKLAHVVYRGRSAMMKALIAGHVPIAMDNLPPYLQHLQSGALRASGRQLGQALVRHPRRADCGGTGLCGLRCRALVVCRGTLGHAPRGREEPLS